MADLNYNEAGTHVLVKHSETGGVWEAPVDFLPVAQKLGWEPTSTEEDPLAGLVDPPEEQTGFDPSQATVSEVNDYLAQHAESSPGEVYRVLELEKAGKNRSSVAVPDGFDLTNSEEE